MPDPVRAVLFDLDGTLIDSERHSHDVISQVLRRLGLPERRLPDHRVYGCRWIDIAEDLIADLDLDAPAPEALTPEQLAGLLSDTYDGVVFAHVEPIPGAVEAVREAARHLPVGLVTSSPATYAQQALEALGLDTLIPRSRRVTAGEVPRGKPSPDPFLLGAERVGVPPEAVLVFEDSAAGLAAAEAAGMRRIALVGHTEDHDRSPGAALRSIRDYRALPPDFWAGLGEGRL